MVENHSKLSRKSGNLSSLATLADVAVMAGVSLATASRALNGQLNVDETLKLRVEMASASLSYVPHASAKALASRRTMRIACLLPTIDNSIFARFAEALQRSIRTQRFGMMVSVTDFSEEIERRAIHEVVAAGVDGIILVGARRSQSIYKFLAKHRIRFLLTSIYAPQCRHPQVGYDNAAASLGLVEYLIRLGHRRIGVIDSPAAGNDRAADRLAGIRQALAQHGLNLEPNAILEQKFTIENGRKGLRMLLEEFPDITGIVCGNDILAVGALLEARAMGLRVPQDLSIAGFDDLELASQLEMGLTTVRVPNIEMGEQAGQILIKMIEGQPAPFLTSVRTSLIVRGSTDVPRSN